jgi:hypothetical protein
MTSEPDTNKLSFEEFKLYYESTEKVTDRRLATNRWNYSICVAILVAIAAITKWSLTVASLLWIGFAAVAVLSIMAMLFCGLWVGQIRDFKKLNNAKFSVLNEMAPRVEFDSANPDHLVSYRPFEKEWDKLSQLDALEEVGRSNIIALKSSNMEYFIPKAFAGLFGGIFVVLCLVIVLGWPPTTLEQVPSQPGATAPTQGQKP